MKDSHVSQLQHSVVSRRTAIQAGAIGLLGMGMNHLSALQSEAAAAGKANIGRTSFGKAKSCIYIFLSGGLSQLESFDLKPDAPNEVRGDFKPAATSTPGIHISEHLPGLAKRSKHWAVVRSMTHPTNGHTKRLGYFVPCCKTFQLRVGVAFSFSSFRSLRKGY